jgi:hypothetical protein
LEGIKVDEINKLIASLKIKFPVSCLWI